MSSNDLCPNSSVLNSLNLYSVQVHSMRVRKTLLLVHYLTLVGANGAWAIEHPIDEAMFIITPVEWISLQVCGLWACHASWLITQWSHRVVSGISFPYQCAIISRYFLYTRFAKLPLHTQLSNYRVQLCAKRLKVRANRIHGVTSRQAYTEATADHSLYYSCQCNSRCNVFPAAFQSVNIFLHPWPRWRQTSRPEKVHSRRIREDHRRADHCY